MRYAVIVKKHIEAPGLKASLAQRLAPVMGARAEQIEVLLARGPLTIEADMSRAEARALCERLVRGQIPAQIFDELGEEDLKLPEVAPAAIAPAAAPKRVSLFEDDEILSALDELDLGHEAVNIGHEPEPPVSLGAWDQVLGRSPAASPASSPVVDEPVVTPAPSAHVSGGWAALGFGEVEAAASTPTPATPPKPAPVQAPAMSFGAEPLAPEPAPAPKPTPAPLPSFTPTPPTAEERATIAQARRFDGGTISDAFSPDQEPAPYRPSGYNDRPPHSPEIAFGLAVLAPGAGHVYNGDHDAAMKAASWFFLIKPWIDSARSARLNAEKIAAYERAQPDDGSLLKAIKHAGIWYGAVAVIVGFFSWSLSALYQRVNKEEPKPVISSLVVADAARIASGYTAAAVASAWGELDKAEAQWREDQMSDDERAERLFLVSLPECRLNNFDVCAASMKRVSEINPQHPYAIKLQVWASLSANTRERVPMPEIPGYQDILEYEERAGQGANGGDVVGADMAQDKPAMRSPEEDTGSQE